MVSRVHVHDILWYILWQQNLDWLFLMIFDFSWLLVNSVCFLKFWGNHKKTKIAEPSQDERRSRLWRNSSVVWQYISFKFRWQRKHFWTYYLASTLIFTTLILVSLWRGTEQTSSCPQRPKNVFLNGIKCPYWWTNLLHRYAFLFRWEWVELEGDKWRRLKHRRELKRVRLQRWSICSPLIINHAV